MAKAPIAQENQEDEFCKGAPHEGAFARVTEPHCKTKSAANWLSKHRSECKHPIIPFIRTRFDLTAKQAIDALTLSHQIGCGGVADA